MKPLRTRLAEGPVLIIGCGGMLGEAVHRVFSERFEVAAFDIDVNEPWLRHGDVRDVAFLADQVERLRPCLLINLAALTDLEQCELEPELAWSTNGLGAENVAVVAHQAGIPCVFIGTAGIFDGRQERYAEYDTPNPLSVYGRSKHYGERAVSALCPEHFIFRAGWMMGGGPAKDKKFVNKIFRQLAAGKTTLEVVDDKLGTPTYTDDFARGMLQVIETGWYGLYHMVCRGGGSRHDVASAFVEALGLAGEVELRIVDSDHFRDEYFAPRPASEQLVNWKLQTRGMDPMRDWRQCLEEYTSVFRSELRPSLSRPIEKD